MSGILAALAGIKTAIATAVDEYFNRVTLLLNTSSTNGAQNNTFLDSSTNNFTVTRNGNTTQGTFTPFSQTGWSNYFNGSSSYLSLPSNSALAVGSGDFTIEAWVYITGGTYNSIYDTRSVSSDAAGFVFAVQTGASGAGAYLYNGTAGVIAQTGNSTVLSNGWYHVAFSRSGTSLRGFVNGVLLVTATNSTNFSSLGASFPFVGTSYDVTSDPFVGYISNFRIVKGTAVYTSAFTPSTTPLTAITNTSLLTCQSNRFLDNSTNAFAITANGTPSVQAFSPFLPTAAYDTAVVGGSGYFDGSGDYLANGSAGVVNFSTGQFTIDYWFYPTAAVVSAYKQHVGAANSASGIAVGTSTSGYLNATSSVAAIATGNASVIPYAWNHIVWTRDASNNIRAFLNGKLTAYAASITTSFTDTGVGIGGTPGGAYTIDGGYFCNMRVVKSLVSDYSTSSTTLGTQIFTPPTAPTTAVTNTSLLLNFTNAGIYDSASKNVLETVGNAQVSTTQAKWGTTSISMDGTGDYLSIPYSVTGDLGGTTQFTIEFWVYMNSLAARGTVAARNNGSTAAGSQFDLNIETTGQINISFYTGGTTITINSATSIITTGSWIHVALSKDGSGNYKIFVNGTQSGTTVTNTSSINSPAIPLTIGAQNTSGGVSLNGYIDDLRITRGLARYTANFTAPTAAFPLQ